ncbi:hypothetical protein L226DRAFT_615314 [Lentinus tigrinus ALCF2SS1-7]|uniref:DUF6533 domain-containing protein n=1 Tax=Lentinus tigrinus ALCF2SS1-6 TaxID=1328759 RepID=A0A5C2S0M5_9APHY|nr:hypothetical protein L227DRAFT_655809 [Lentinus tigrinus ALCF2SS1-6]RPD71808.1 hypothetical protein L226DRAFT_615314 [Lentinus tigrinus ALCF2SS1-7]
MSSGADGSAAAIAALIFSNLYTDTYCGLAASVLFIYDSLVILDREVACFWTSRRIGPSLLFFANKWISMTVYVMTLLEFATFPSDQSCASFQRVGVAMQILQLVPGAVFSAMRAYVLCRSKLLGLLTLVLSLSPVGAHLARYGYNLAGENFQPFGCFERDNVAAESLGLRVILVSRVPLIVADILLIFITWTKVGSRDTLRGIRESKRLSLSDILLRDGTLYFVVLLILNVLHLAFSLSAVAGNGQESFLTAFTTPITAILISRFLLDLREANRAVMKLDPDDPLHSSKDPYDDTPSFISSLGAFVSPDLPPPHDDASSWDVDSHSADPDAEGSEGQAPEIQSAASSSSVTV